MCGSRRPNKLRFGPCRTRIFSGASCRSIPVLLQVRDQGRAEVAVCLFPRIDRDIAAERVERLLPGAEGAPVARGADYAGPSELLHRAVYGIVDILRRDDLIADHAAFGARAVE